MAKLQLGMGIPMALQSSITACGTIVMQSAINYFGSVAIAAYTAVLKLQNLLTQGMVAMGQMAATYAGQNAGKRDASRIEEGVRASLKIDVVYSVVVALITAGILPFALSLFFPEGTGAVMPYARIYVYLSIIFYIPLSFIYVYRNFMQGSGYSLMPMLGGVVEMLARFVFAFLGIRFHSYILACFCDPAAWFSAALFLAVAYRGVWKKMRAEWGVG